MPRLPRGEEIAGNRVPKALFVQLQLTPIAQAPLPPPPPETLEARLTREGWTYDPAVRAWSRLAGPTPPPKQAYEKGMEWISRT
jgi:hypothetical protein